MFKTPSLDSGTKIQSRVSSPQRISVTYQSGFGDTHTVPPSHAGPKSTYLPARCRDKVPSIANPSHHLLATDTTAAATVSPLPKVAVSCGWGMRVSGAPPTLTTTAPLSNPRNIHCNLHHTCLLYSLRRSVLSVALLFTAQHHTLS